MMNWYKQLKSNQMETRGSRALVKSQIWSVEYISNSFEEETEFFLQSENNQ